MSSELTSTLGHLELLGRLGAAVVIGTCLGLNRNLHDKPAGVRTHALVALGAALATVMGSSYDSNAFSRIAQGVIQGIGFLGAGVILHSEKGKSVHGLTTAASVWVSAIVGLACGAGMHRPVLFAFGLALFILMLGGPFEKHVHAFFGYTGKSIDDDSNGDPPSSKEK